MSFHQERRDTKSQRIAFEAIVELGGEVDPKVSMPPPGTLNVRLPRSTERKLK